MHTPGVISTCFRKSLFLLSTDTQTLLRQKVIIMSGWLAEKKRQWNLIRNTRNSSMLLSLFDDSFSSPQLTERRFAGDCKLRDGKDLRWMLHISTSGPMKLPWRDFRSRHSVKWHLRSSAMLRSVRSQKSEDLKFCLCLASNTPRMRMGERWYSLMH